MLIFDLANRNNTMKESDNATKLIRDLKERQKELECLYRISNLLKNNEEPLEKLLIKVVESIPPGFQHPSICKARITIRDLSIEQKDLKETELSQKSNIVIDGKKIGEVQVYYIKPIKSETESIFLHEEKRLIDAIANEIGQFLTINHYKNLVIKNNKRTRNEISLSLSEWLTQWDLSDIQINKILGSQISFNKDELFLKQGTKVYYLLLLTDGLIKLSIGDPAGKNFVLKICKPFEFIGLDTSLDNNIWDYSATTITKSKGYLIDFDLIKECLSNNQNFKNKVFQFYGKSSFLLYQKINILANRQALGRLTSTLLYLWNDIYDRQVIENSITRKTIADLSGISTENAVRILSELNKDNVIKLQKEGIKLIDNKTLETYSNVG